MYKNVYRKLGSIETVGIDTQELRITKSTVTQATNSTTAVTINAHAGVITTVSLTNAGEASNTFTVNNNQVASDSAVVASICNYVGNGIPVVHVNNVSNGSFTITVFNSHGSAALNAAAKISFIVV